MFNLLKRAALACALLFAGGLAAPAFAADCTTTNVPASASAPADKAIYDAVVKGCVAFADVVAISASPTTSTSPAYSSGDVIGSLLTFAGAARASGGAGLIQSVTIAFKSTQTAATDFVWCGDSTTPNSTETDNAPVAIIGADFDKCRVIHVTDCTSLGTPTVCAADNLAFPYTLSSGTTGFGFLVTRGTPTLASTSDVTVTLRLIRN